MSGWQSIETAPKMRTILLYATTDVGADGAVKNWKMETGFWHSGHRTWMWAGYDTQPTHWMLLPEPPSDTLTTPKATESQAK